MSIGRREFLKSSAALAAVSAAGGFSCIEIAAAAPIEVPTIDGLSIRVLVDSSYDLFFRPAELNGVKIAPPARLPDFRRSLHNEWGLSLWLESERGAEKRTVMRNAASGGIAASDCASERQSRGCARPHAMRAASRSTA